MVVQTKILHFGQRDMCSWNMVNNEENLLPWQIKDWFNKKYKKSQQKVFSPWDWLNFKSAVPKGLMVQGHICKDNIFGTGTSATLN